MSTFGVRRISSFADPIWGYELDLPGLGSLGDGDVTAERKPKIDRFGLVGYALAGAYALDDKFPGAIVITSGLRDVKKTSVAMAGREYRQRGWIKATYAGCKTGACHSTLVQQMVDWSAANPKSDLNELIAAFAQILNSGSDDDRNKVSYHFTGHAIDLRPIADPDLAQQVIAFITGETGPFADPGYSTQHGEHPDGLPGLDWFTTTEGGQHVWHLQFDSTGDFIVDSGTVASAAQAEASATTPAVAPDASAAAPDVAAPSVDATGTTLPDTSGDMDGDGSTSSPDMSGVAAGVGVIALGAAAVAWWRSRREASPAAYPPSLAPVAGLRGRRAFGYL